MAQPFGSVLVFTSHPPALPACLGEGEAGGNARCCPEFGSSPAAVSGVPPWRTTASEGKGAGGEPAWGKGRQQHATLLAPCRARAVGTAPRALGAVPAPKGGQHLRPMATEAPLPPLAPSSVPKGTPGDRGRQPERPAPSRRPRGAPGAAGAPCENGSSGKTGIQFTE